MLKLKIPPPIYMLVTAAIMWLLNQTMPLISFQSDFTNLLGKGFIAAALLSDGFSVWQFLKNKTTFNPLHPENSNQLVTTGLYAFSRNPMYVGLLVLLLGWGLILGSLSAFLILPLFIIVINTQQIIPEEQILERKFNQDYLDYKMAVRRWL